MWRLVEGKGRKGSVCGAAALPRYSIFKRSIDSEDKQKAPEVLEEEGVVHGKAFQRM